MAGVDRRTRRQQSGGVEPRDGQGGVRLPRGQRDVPHRQVRQAQRVRHRDGGQAAHARVGLRPRQPQGAARGLQPGQAAAVLQVPARGRGRRVLLRRDEHGGRAQGEPADEAVQARGAQDAAEPGRGCHGVARGGPHAGGRRRRHRGRHGLGEPQGGAVGDAGRGGGHHGPGAPRLAPGCVRGDGGVLDVPGQNGVAGGGAEVHLPPLPYPRRRLPGVRVL
mmetsp:Transcript_27035/g.71194  ORF Transcript_27035/g.71194 Transcript_27035/m.71194 type:complete len:221 (-) Transcript_27035:952-1614(-)